LQADSNNGSDSAAGARQPAAAGNVVVAAASQVSREAAERPRMMQRNTAKVRVLTGNMAQSTEAGALSDLG